MVYFVTGASGFIGKQLVPLLREQGHKAYTTQFDPATFLNLEPDVCIHLAWRGYAGSGGAEENLRSVRFGLKTLEDMAELGCKRFVGIGTCFEYAPANERLSEDAPLAPSGTNPFYSRCKLLFSEIAEHYCASVGMSFAWARIFNCYGPGEAPERLIPSVMRAAEAGEVVQLTGGDQVRDYLHVADVASALAVIASSDITGAVNVCSGVGTRVEQIARLAAPEAVLSLGAKPYRKDDPMYLVGQNARLRSLGWQPRYSLAEGLASCAAV